MYAKSPAAKRLEFRTPDPSCNPYLAFAACLQAGLDGVRNKIEPPTPIDKDLYDLEADAKAAVQQVPGSLEEVLTALKNDHDWLLEGGVFTEDVIETWIDFKTVHELDQVRLRPHPWEFMLYYDI
jgi:glutamine synthetase